MKPMGFPQIIILAVLQGLTEFLPVSSSGHLVIFQKLFNLTEPPVLFDILVHVGTLGAILIYFRKRLAQILNGLARKDKKSWNILLMVVVGTIPAAMVGLFLQSHITQIFDSLRLAGTALLITGGLLLFSRRFPSSVARRHLSPQLRRRRSSTTTNKESLGCYTEGFFKSLNRRFNSLKWQDALFVGCFQALAIIPGISRSGSTIVSGLWRKFDRETAFRFSFYLAIPAILGALILQTPNLIYSPYGYLEEGILGMLVAGAIGYGALRLLEKTLLSAKFWLFGIYCLVLGIIVLLI